MNAGPSPFAPRTMLALIAVGSAAFLVFLYALGAGWNGQNEREGRAHAAATGLNGYAALAQLLEARGHTVSLSRTAARLDHPGLLVVTPQLDADADEVTRLIERRRHLGPTLLILPKWFAMPNDGDGGADTPPAWVHLAGAVQPGWVKAVEPLAQVELSLKARGSWRGFGLKGRLPAPEDALALTRRSVVSIVRPLVRDERGDILAGYLHDSGVYPALDEAAGFRSDQPDTSLSPVVIVAEPDLLNNYGLADLARARLAVALVEASNGGEDQPIVFDLTFAGIGHSQNLLTLAFEPPFLAATMCLLLAALVVAWRAAHRFGPPVAEAPVLEAGKRQLARNSAGLIERAGRLHLLGPPYAALVVERLSARLAIREADPAAREAAVAQALAARGLPADLPHHAEALRRARRPHELLRAAGALWTLERTAAS